MSSGATRTPQAVSGLDDAAASFREQGCSAPREWANDPGDRYGRHEHDRHKVLFCLEGSIVFHVDTGDVELHAGDRLDLEPGVAHAATVGRAGCACVEAWRP